MSRAHVYLETFGCQMNELDSELVVGSLTRLGYRFVPTPQQAGVVLYNTCSVREQAEQKVWSRLGELAVRKRAEPNLVVGVLGCLAERDGVDLVRRMPVVDILCGPGELDKLPALLDNAVRTRLSLTSPDREGGVPNTCAQDEKQSRPPLPDGRGSLRAQIALQGNTSRRSATLAAAEDTLELLDLSRAIAPIDSAGARRSAYVRITRGCNKFCTYCVVPFTRGAEIHRPPQHIIDECKALADAGVVEITLLGQTVNHYRFEHGSAVAIDGITQPQKGRAYANTAGVHRRDPFAGPGTTTFADLLYQIHERVPGLRRLRFVTSYPRDFGDDVLQAIRDCPRICRYLHVPAQSGSDRILTLMNRGYTVAQYIEFLDRARSFLDEPRIGRPLMISGDIIVGFPTETDDDFHATRDLLHRAQYKNCFIFKYSPRPGTTAFDRLTDDMPEPIKRDRNNELLALQGAISDRISASQIGGTFDVLVEGPSRRARQRTGATQGQLRKHKAVALTVGITVAGSSRSLNEHEHEDEHDGSCSATGSHVAAETVDEPCDAPIGSVIQWSSRTEGDQIVFFDAPARSSVSAGQSSPVAPGSIVRVRIERADRLSLHGSLVERDPA